MARTPFTTIAQLGTSLASVNANPASTTTEIGCILLHNTDTVAIAVEMNLVPDSAGSLGTAAASNRIFNQSIPANETFAFEPKFPIILTDENDAIFAKAGTASKVNIIISGARNV